MEVRSELGILSGGDSFGVSIQQSPTPSPSPMMQNRRMAFGGEGTAVYRPVTGVSAPASYQGAGGELPAAQGISLNPGQPVKRKRGRPKKFDSDGTMAIGLSSAPAASPAAAGAVAGSSTGFSLSYAPAAATLAPESSLQLVKMKKARGRPPGSTNKHQINALGSGGVGFNPHVITVKAGEDVSAKIMSFSHSGPRAVCILSANGAISNVTLRQAATSGGTVTYEGRFEILSLSGSFLLSESAGQRSRTGGLSVSLAGPDGRVLGGGVAGLLTAASPVQVVVGSFIADGGRKEEQQINPLDVSPAPGKLAPAGMPGPSSPPSRGTLSESSGGGPGSPFNQSINDNNNQQSLPNMSWK